MSEIERAIEYYEQTLESIKHMMVECELKNEIVSAHKTALTVLRAELEREKNPLTCDGCKSQEGMYVDDNLCYDCRRYETLPDRYEPKGEPNV